MKVAILYRSKSEHERKVLDFERDFEARSGKTVELLDVNTREGSAMANLYDVMSYPSLVAVSGDGMVQHVWNGAESMPLINEVMFYTISE